MTVLLAVLASTPVLAQTAVEDPWVRPTVPTQEVTGAYMKLKSTEGAKLVAVKTPAAKATEIHEMKLENNVMKMREIRELDLPAGRWVELKPGGYHLMLFDVVKPILKGETVRMTLVLEDRAGKRSELEVTAKVGPPR